MGVDLDFVKSQLRLPSFVLRGLPFDDLAVKLGKRAHGETECRDDDIKEPHGPLMENHQTRTGRHFGSIRPGPHPGHGLLGNLEAVAGNKPRHNESDGDNGNGRDNLPTAAEHARNGIIAVCEIDDVKPPHEQYDERRVARGPATDRQQPDHERQQDEAESQVDHKGQTVVRAHFGYRFIRGQR